MSVIFYYFSIPKSHSIGRGTVIAHMPHCVHTNGTIKSDHIAYSCTRAHSSRYCQSKTRFYVVHRGDGYGARSGDQRNATQGEGEGQAYLVQREGPRLPSLCIALGRCLTTKKTLRERVIISVLVVKAGRSRRIFPSREKATTKGGSEAIASENSDVRNLKCATCVVYTLCGTI